MLPSIIVSYFFVSATFLIGYVSGGDYAQQTVTKEIEEGNYTYYKITEPGRVIVRLVSLEGDADLYISAEHTNPSFELDEHAFSSTTCGVDLVDIDQEVPRPLFVGVYGYPQFSISKYELTVTIYKYSDPSDPFNNIGDDLPAGYEDPDAKIGDEGYGIYGRGGDERSAISLLWPVISSILEIAIDVLL